MKVPFQLRRRPTAAPARALWLPAADAKTVLDVCARMGSGRTPEIFLLAEGFLVRLATETMQAFPGAVRLRAVAENLFVPCDADLTPPLLDDEAAGLGRQRGLVFLPGGRVLAFAPGDPVPLSALLRPANGKLLRRDWQPLPEPPLLAERIVEIVLERPPIQVDDLLQSGAGDIGTEEPRPDDAPAGTHFFNQIKMKLGQGLMGLGNALGWAGLAMLGAQWVKKAVEMVPRLTEDLLGRQEAALRNLLKDFREGNVDKALKRALPMGEPGGRGNRVHTNARLPTHNLRYTLGGLLGGGGATSVWFGGEDVQQELSREYRKAAEEAQKAGDFRRAAFIYGRLLHDYHAAANALAAGGLHLDAAMIYLEKVKDRNAAARMFEAAGEFDRALQLYRETSDHVAAGDLLVRLSEPEGAVAEYRQAAARLASNTSRGMLMAGELLLTKAGCTELAEEYFHRGWNNPQQSQQCLACGVHLAKMYAARPTPDKLLALVEQGEGLFAEQGHETSASHFFNVIAGLADRPNLAAVRGELRDRALRTLAIKMKQGVEIDGRVGTLVQTLLTRTGNWEVPLVGDAEHAVKRGGPRPARGVRGLSMTRLGFGKVSAVACARNTSAIFVGFENGELIEFDPVSGGCQPVCSPLRGTIASLASSADGRDLAVLSTEEKGLWKLLGYRREGSGRRSCSQASFAGSFVWLLPSAESRERSLVGLWHQAEVLLLDPTNHGIRARPQMPDVDDPITGFVLPTEEPDGRLHLLVGSTLWNVTLARSETVGANLGWSPRPPRDSALFPVPLSWRQVQPDHLEMVGVTAEGCLGWAHLWLNPDQPRCLQSHLTPQGEYRAAALVRSKRVAAVGQPGVAWFRCGAKSFEPMGTLRMPLPSALACFTSHLTEELLIVCDDGTLFRVRLPS